MTIRFTLFLLALFLAHPVWSEPARVRSGEHEGFTRIVIDLPRRSEWQLNEEAGQATLIFTGQELEFDTSAVFDRLSDGRLGGISAADEKSALTMVLGCECELTTFWYGASSLVVDILDVAAQPEIASEEKSDVMANDVTMEGPKEKPVLQLLFPSDEGLSVAAAIAASGLQPGLPDMPATVFEPAMSPSPNPRIATKPVGSMQKTREKLLRQIGRAATQGLLSPNVTVPEVASQSTNPAIANGGTEKVILPVITEAEARKETTAYINIRAQSSIDRDFQSALAQAADDFGGSNCIGPRQIDVALWGSDASFADQIGAVRVRLAEELDKTNQAAALELSKLYLYFGFGVEARQSLELLSASDNTKELLLDLVAIFEQGYAPVGSVLSGQLGCGAPVSLWSALSYQTLPTDVPVDDKSILRGFSALPPHLRSYLGPILSRRFLDAGYPKTSDQVLRILDRSDETVTPDADLVKAEIEIAEGDYIAADKVLDDVITSSSKPSAEALLRKIETGLEAGDEISFETAQLAGAYAQENRDEPLGRALSEAYIVSLAASGAFDQSYREFARLKPELAPVNQRAAQSSMLGFLAENADEMTFLQQVFADNTGAPDELDAKEVNATAKRLLALGFIKKARYFVTSPALEPQGRVRALLRAEMSLQEDRPRQAELDLQGLTGEDVNLLRAMARSRVGQHKAAAQLFTAGNHIEMAAREAWLAEDWKMISVSEDPALSGIAKLVMPDLQSLPPEDLMANEEGVLAMGRNLIEASKSTRDTIAALLISKPGPDTVTE